MGLRDYGGRRTRGGETEGLQAPGAIEPSQTTFQAPADDPLLLRPPGHNNRGKALPGAVTIYAMDIAGF